MADKRNKTGKSTRTPAKTDEVETNAATGAVKDQPTTSAPPSRRIDTAPRRNARSSSRGPTTRLQSGNQVDAPAKAPVKPAHSNRAAPKRQPTPGPTSAAQVQERTGRGTKRSCRDRARIPMESDEDDDDEDFVPPTARKSSGTQKVRSPSPLSVADRELAALSEVVDRFAHKNHIRPSSSSSSSTPTNGAAANHLAVLTARNATTTTSVGGAVRRGGNGGSNERQMTQPSSAPPQAAKTPTTPAANVLVQMAGSSSNRPSIHATSSQTPVLRAPAKPSQDAEYRTSLEEPKREETEVPAPRVRFSHTLQIKTEEDLDASVKEPPMAELLEERPASEGPSNRPLVVVATPPISALVQNPALEPPPTVQQLVQIEDASFALRRLEVVPKRMVFCAPFDTPHANQIVLKNNSERSMAFRISMSKPEFHSVRSPMGTIAPKSEMRFNVLRVALGSERAPDEEVEYSMKVQYRNAPPGVEVVDEDFFNLDGLVGRVAVTINHIN